MRNVVLSTNGQCYLWKRCREGAQLKYMVLLIVYVYIGTQSYDDTIVQLICQKQF